MHPYTKGLLGSYADPRAETIEITYIPGRPPSLSASITGCAFAPRCPQAIEVCQLRSPALLALGHGQVACHVAAAQRGATGDPSGTAALDTAPLDTALLGVAPDGREVAVTRFAGPVFTKTPAPAVPGSASGPVGSIVDSDIVLRMDGVSKTYTRRRAGHTSTVDAVAGVSLVLRRGRVTALVGQSGSGKTTIARMLTGVERPDAGTILFGEQRVDRLPRRAARSYRSHVQMVFQDPFAALNPNRTVGYALSRPLRNYRGLRASQVPAHAARLLETVGLTPAADFLDKFPHQLSGGQRQRVVVARALAPEPDIIVADEPIAMLDVSIRAEILQLLDSLVRERGIAILYITHDLLSARLLADDILVMHQGRVVEAGPALAVIRQASHEYTRLLLAAIPDPRAAGARPEVAA